MVFHRKPGAGQDYNTYFSCTKNAYAEDSYCAYRGNTVEIQSMGIWPGSTSYYYYYYPDNPAHPQKVTFNIRCIRDIVR